MAVTAESMPLAQPEARRRPSIVARLLSRPSAAFGLVVVVGLVLVAAIGPWLAPHPYQEQDITQRLESPSAEHPLGTDELGRDNLSRVIYGTRVALQVAVPAVLVAALIGLFLGAVAGYFQGLIDLIVVALIDILQSFPMIVLALALVALVGPSLRNIIFVIALAVTPYYVRVARAQTLAVKQNQFIEAERALGASSFRIITTHVMPNILPPILILIAMDIPTAVAAEAGLSFLGLGLQPPTPSWGSILADGFGNIYVTPWPLIAAGAALMLTTLGFTLLGEGLRDVLDPRSRAGRRSLRRRSL